MSDNMANHDAGIQQVNGANEVRLDHGGGTNAPVIQVHAAPGAVFPPNPVVFNNAHVPVNTFYIFAGPQLVRFAINIHDLRNESELLRQTTAITSVELRNANPAAVEIIHNWFRGNVGRPPITRAQRLTFVEAANIAKQLRIKECEAQLIVINAKVCSVLANIFYDQLETNLMLDPVEVHEMLNHQLKGWLRRSPNVGGEEGSDAASDIF